jgi:apolipoprotein N-acyltransferase
MNDLLAKSGAFVRGLKGWKRLAFAFAAGLLSALAFAPFGLFPFLLLGFAALVLLIDGAEGARHPVRAAALAGWAFGFGQFLFGLHWIVYAFMVDPSAHEWQIPFVAVLFPGGLALFIAAACAVAAALWRSGAARIFLFTVCYAVAEWLRGHVLTGFPWNVAAYGWGLMPGVLQSVALFGSYGLTVLTILLGASLAEFFGRRPKPLFPAVMCGILALLWLGGEARLATTPTETVHDVKLRLVQPNVPQAEKYKRQFVLRNWQRLVSLSERPGNPTLIVWPEAAASPYLLWYRQEALEQISALTAHGAVLMMGTIRGARDDAGVLHMFNSFYVFGRNGRILDIYDKSHLVPFGEYLPFEKTLEGLGLSKLTGIEGSFAGGDGPHTYDVSGAGAVGPLICYEVLFPGEVVGSRRPEWFANATDDSWFGPWAGPRQHLLVARVRAIEEGIPMVRAATTGISAIIDPLGRITAELGLGKMGIVDGGLPAAIAPTPYSRHHEWWFWLMVCANVALTWRLYKGK